MVRTRRARASSLVGPSGVNERPVKKIKFEGDTSASLGATKQQRNLRANESIQDGTANPERAQSPWKVGAHVSAAGGVENAVVNAAAIGANAFALFLKSQRKWSSPSLAPSSIEAFKARMQQYGYENRMVLPHGSYLINLGNPDPEKREKSYGCFLDDLKRCEELGLELYNFHPGSTVGVGTKEDSISLVAECINRAHKETGYVTTVLENMAGAGNIIGSDFAHLAGIIERVEDKSRVAVCLDTCHMFSAGYDVRSKEAWDSTMKKFDTQVGLSYLRGMHLNDSKTELNSKRDRHENIGLGHLGIEAFHHILTDPRVQDIPLILETPSFERPERVWAKEIAVLQSLSAMSLEDVGALGDEIKNTVQGAADSSGNKVAGSSRAKGSPTSKARKTKTTRGRKGSDNYEDVEDSNNEHAP